MNLPNYFLADVPPGATLNGQMLWEACQTLKRNREQYLADRPTRSLIKVLHEVSSNWLDPEYPFRKLALEKGPDATGFSAATLASGLGSFFQQLNGENLEALVIHDLGHGQRLDEMVAGAAEQKAGCASIAIGPEFTVHIAAGTIPNPAFTNIALGFLTRSAQFVKCATGASFLPRMFAHSIYDADPKLAACLEIAEWPGGNVELEGVLFAEADCVTVTGSDETITALRARVPSNVKMISYGHRVSFGYVAAEALSGFHAKKVLARAATDVIAWDQLGCLSPHVLYVEHGGGLSAEQFAEELAAELARRELTEPRGRLAPEDAATIASKRSFYKVRAANSPDTRLWCSEDSTAWTVVYEADARFQLSSLHRFIYVKAVTDLADLLQGAENVRGKVSTVGLAATEDRAPQIATQLARWGVTRVCPLGQMQSPPLTWRHDGRPSLGDLIRWTNWEL
jgi:acyl-CoA reductase LuxC